MKRLFKLKRSIWVILLSMLSACGPSGNEKEPQNNDRLKAQRIDVDKEFTGTFYRKDKRDIDYLYFETTEKTMLKGVLSGVKGIDSEILFYTRDSSEPFKVINDNLESLEEKFGPLLIEPPGVIIALQPRRIVNQPEYEKEKYTFLLHSFSPVLPVEQEPNDSFENAQLMTDQGLTGYYSNVYSSEGGKSQTAIEKDFFYIDIETQTAQETDSENTIPEEEQKYLVSVTLTSVSGIDPVLRIYDSKENVLQVVDEKGLGQGEKIENFGITGHQKLVISVNAKDQKINDNDYYEISYELSKYRSENEFEPNDTILKASRITRSKTYANISSAQDKDFFYYENTSNKTEFMNFVFIPGAGMNLSAHITDINEKPLLTLNDAGIEENEGVSHLAIAPSERVYFLVENTAAETEKADYSIEMNQVEKKSSFEREPNNSPSKYNVLSSNGIISGYINPASDKDFFKIDVDKQSRMKIMVDGIENCRIEIKVTDKQAAVTSKETAKRFSEGLSFAAIVEPGSYIVAGCSESRGSLHEKTYRIKLEEQ